MVKISSTDFRILRHGFLISQHVRACRHVILAPGWFGASSAWNELCGMMVLLEDVSTGQSKFINKEISRIIVYEHCHR